MLASMCLGGTRSFLSSGEYGRSTMRRLSCVALRYAAWSARKTGRKWIQRNMAQYQRSDASSCVNKSFRITLYNSGFGSLRSHSPKIRRSPSMARIKGRMSSNVLRESMRSLDRSCPPGRSQISPGSFRRTGESCYIAPIG